MPNCIYCTGKRSCLGRRAPSPSLALVHIRQQFNFTPITCLVTGAGRPGVVRQDALEAAASRLGKATLEDSLGPAARKQSECSLPRRLLEVGGGGGLRDGDVGGVGAGTQRGRHDGLGKSGQEAQADGNVGEQELLAGFDELEAGADPNLVRYWIAIHVLGRLKFGTGEWHRWLIGRVAPLDS